MEENIDEIYIQFGENRIGTEICLRRWQEKPFEGGVRYLREPKKTCAWAVKLGDNINISSITDDYGDASLDAHAWRISGKESEVVKVLIQEIPNE